MPTRITTAAQNVAVDAITPLINAGGAGKMEIRTGAQPPSANDVATGTVLAEVPLAADAFGDASNGQASATGTPLEDPLANASGIAGWFRVLSGANTPVFDGQATLTGGGGQLQLNSLNVEAGGPVRITSFTFGVPAGS